MFTRYVMYVEKMKKWRMDHRRYLNYDVPQDVPQDKLDAQIVDLIRKNSKISTEKIASALGVSSKTIKRHIKEMDNVCYIGRGFSGHWEITNDK